MSVPSSIELAAERQAVVCRRLSEHLECCRAEVDLAAERGAPAETIETVRAQIRRLADVLTQGPVPGETDADLARRLVAALVPESLPSIRDLDLALHVSPSAAGGGNVVLVLPVAAAHVVVVLFDASGHGLPVAYLSVWASLEVMRCVAAGTHGPRALLHYLNMGLLEGAHGRYLRAFVADLDLDLMEMTYVNASHREPLWLRAGRTESIDTQGLFVGLFEDAEYEEKRLRLAEGEVLLFYSDAVVDALRYRAGLVEPAGLLAFVAEHQRGGPRPLVDALAAEVLDHGGREHHDDTLVLAVGCRHVEDWHAVVIPSDVNEGKRICDAILEHCTLGGFTRESIFATKLALEEAMTNAIKHGNGGDPAKRVHVRYSVSPARMVVVIADEGAGFDPGGVPDPTAEDRLDRPAGRGIWLMRHYLTGVEYNARGNEVKLIRDNS